MVVSKRPASPAYCHNSSSVGLDRRYLSAEKYSRACHVTESRGWCLLMHHLSYLLS
jgi:hypothetical protein